MPDGMGTGQDWESCWDAVVVAAIGVSGPGYVYILKKKKNLYIYMFPKNKKKHVLCVHNRRPLL